MSGSEAGRGRRPLVAAAALAFLHAGAAAQRPAVSPRLAPFLERDTTIAVWVMLRPGVDLALAREVIGQAGGRLRVVSRWLHAVSAEADGAALRRLAADPRLARLQPVARWRGRPEPVESVEPAALLTPPTTAQDSLYGPGIMPYRRLNILPLSERGITGAGVRIALLDSGFDTANPAFAGVTVPATRDFVFGDTVVRDEPADQPGAHSHGTAVWSLLAANLPGQLLGVAREATYLLAKTEDIRSETRVEEDHYVAALEWADSLGVDIVSSSLGYLDFADGFAYVPGDLNGDIAVTTVAADAAAQRGILVVTAAGNEGPAPQTLVTPADGDSVIAAGAVDSLGAVPDFSSRGPTADGRIKPDLSAPGVSVWVITGSGSFGRVTGTSLATPLIAGVAALVKQVHPARGPTEVRQALQLNASNRATPDFARGFGTPDATAAVSFPEGLQPLAPVTPPLTSVTPTFVWQAAGVPAVAAPVTYRLRLARDSLFQDLLLDTTIQVESHRLAEPLRPAETFRWSVSARSSFGVEVQAAPPVTFVAPAWATLTSIDDPGGTVLTDRQPEFTWSFPEADPPIGPFRFDVEIRLARSGVIAVAGRSLSGPPFRPPTPLEANTPYRWRVIAWLGADSAVTESRAEFVVVDTLVPPATLLYPNFPNPFPAATDPSGGTCLWFDLAQPGSVSLDILDLRGHVLRRLVPGAGFPPTLDSGRYGRPSDGASGSCDPRLRWDGRTDGGELVPPGVYMVRLRTPAGTHVQRMVFKGG